MIAPLDVFDVSSGKEGMWLTAADSLPQALAFIRARGAGKYMVFSQTTGHKNVYEVTSDRDPILLHQLDY